MSKDKIQDDKPKGSIKNYSLLLLIFVAVVGLTLYLCKWYNVYDEYQKETPVIRGTLSEIGNDEFEHYVMDNPSTIIYMCTSESDACREFEYEFKKLIIKNAYKDEIVYFNLSGLDIDKFVDDFNSKYQYKVKLTSNYPAFIVYRDGEIESILQGTDDNSLTMSKVKGFIELYKVGE